MSCTVIDSELWSQRHARAGHALLRLPLPAAQRARVGEGRPRAPAAAARSSTISTCSRAPRSRHRCSSATLGELAYVVFDTETTGLDPQGADRIVQIAAVRIVNRRLLTGEVFDAPGQSRPADPRERRPASTASPSRWCAPAAARDRAAAVPRLCRGGVLVAHNAAFDMAFLRREEARLALRFDQPVLDTLLLSAVLHDHVGEHGLDAIAARFGIAIEGRHRALGDAIGTGRLFLRMLELLEAQGVSTLGQALALAERAVALRRQPGRAVRPPRQRAATAAGRASLMRDEQRGKRLIAVALLALVAFNFPLLAAAEAGPSVLGLPPLFAYLFGAWAGLIALLALIVERRR